MAETIKMPQRYQLKTLEAVETQPLAVSVGVKPQLFGVPRPDLAGYRVKVPKQAPIWVIDQDGYRRWIPNPTTFNNLFRDWSVVEELDVANIAETVPIDDGAILFKGSATANVYLTDRGNKRWITSPAVMDKYNFNWGKIVVVPQILVNMIPTGLAWQ